MARSRASVRWHFGLGSHTNGKLLYTYNTPYTVLLHHQIGIIWYTNAEKFRYEGSLAISALNLLSYVVGVGAQLGACV